MRVPGPQCVSVRVSVPPQAAAPSGLSILRLSGLHAPAAWRPAVEPQGAGAEMGHGVLKAIDYQYRFVESI